MIIVSPVQSCVSSPVVIGGGVNWNPQFDTPPNIATDYLGYVAWREKRKLQFMLHCPTPRGRTFFFSTSGNDANDGLTEATPKRRLSEAQSIIDASPQDADLRLRFKRGDIWKENTGITTNKDNITLDDYGTGDKPKFNRFLREYLAADNPWVNVAGNAYALLETIDIAWIREINDPYGIARGTHIIREANATAVQGTDFSYFYDPVTDMLHINMGGIDPNTIDFEAVPSNSSSGIEFQGDGCRAHNFINDGWGCHRTQNSTQDQGATNRNQGDEANLFIGIEAYYGTSHTLAHNNPGASAVGGKSMWLNCKSGYTKFNGTASETVFNSFSQLGEFETWFLDCEVTFGTLKSSDWSYESRISRGTGFFCHTGERTGTKADLMVVDGCTVKAGNPTSCERIFGLGDLPDIQDDNLATSRGFIVDCVREAENVSHEAASSFGSNVIVYGGREIHHPQNINPLALDVTPGRNHYRINHYLEMDMTAVGSGTFGVYNPVGSVFDVTFVHCAIKLINTQSGLSNRFGIDFDVRGNASGDPGTGSSSDCRMFNSVVSYSGIIGSNSHFLGLTNVEERIRANAYFQVAQDAADERGYANDAELVELNDEYVIDTRIDQLIGAGSVLFPEELRPSHDINGLARGAGVPDIGPVNVSAIPPTLSNFVDGVLAEYSANIDESVGEAGKWKNIEPTPADGSSQSDWNMVAATLAGEGQKPELVDVGGGVMRWEFKHANNNPSDEGDSYFLSETSDATNPPFIRNFSKPVGDREITFIYKGIIANGHSPSALIGVGGVNDRGFLVESAFNSSSSLDGSRLFVYDDAGGADLFSRLRQGASAGGIDGVVIQTYRYNDAAGTVESATYINNNTPIRPATQAGVTDDLLSSDDPVGGFSLFFQADRRNSPPLGSFIEDAAVLNRFVDDADEVQAIIDYFS